MIYLTYFFFILSPKYHKADKSINPLKQSVYCQSAPAAIAAAVISKTFNINVFAYFIKKKKYEEKNPMPQTFYYEYEIKALRSGTESWDEMLPCTLFFQKKTKI